MECYQAYGEKTTKQADWGMGGTFSVISLTASVFVQMIVSRTKSNVLVIE